MWNRRDSNPQYPACKAGALASCATTPCVMRINQPSREFSKQFSKPCGKPIPYENFKQSYVRMVRLELTNYGVWSQRLYQFGYIRILPSLPPLPTPACGYRQRTTISEDGGTRTHTLLLFRTGFLNQLVYQFQHIPINWISTATHFSYFLGKDSIMSSVNLCDFITPDGTSRVSKFCPQGRTRTDTPEGTSS